MHILLEAICMGVSYVGTVQRRCIEDEFFKCPKEETIMVFNQVIIHLKLIIKWSAIILGYKSHLIYK